MAVIVRRAEAGDIPQLVELSAMIQAAHVAAEPAFFKPAQPGETAAWFAVELERGSLSIWVAAEGDDLVGYAVTAPQVRDENVFCYARSWWEVDQLGVRLGWRRRGVARALLTAIAAAGREAGVARLQLSTWSFNTSAQEAWRHLGFEPQASRYDIDLQRL